MKIEETEVYGFRAALRGMRNPKNSWNLSDSKTTIAVYDDVVYWSSSNANGEGFILGEKDKILSQALCKAGSEHCKHLRFVTVWADLTLPRFIWQEFDTYHHVQKISCSTMHTLMKKPINKYMFEDGFDYMPEDLIDIIQGFIDTYVNSNDPIVKQSCKYQTKRILPESFLQKRTVTTNYQCLLNMHNQRHNHELPLWQIIDKWILKLPYFKELTGIKES